MRGYPFIKKPICFLDHFARRVVPIGKKEEAVDRIAVLESKMEEGGSSQGKSRPRMTHILHEGVKKSRT